jgi:pyruvate dehydrogenase E1 component alpha subunit
MYAMGTPASRSLAVEDASVRALGYPMARMTVNGWDIVECYNAGREAIDRARSESLPMLVEFKTYRYRGHSMADPGKYRTKEEVKEWQEKDPLLIAERHIQNDYPDAVSEIDAIKQSVEKEVEDAVEFAHNSPDPDPSTVGDYTYV